MRLLAIKGVPQMTRIKLDPILEKFNKELSKSLSLARDVETFKEFRKGKYRSILKRRAYLIIELSLLQLFMSWENFLEETFVRYMCGGETSSGYSPEGYTKPRNLRHAFDMIKQERPYIDWTAPSIVINKARLFFKDGEPYASALGGAPILEEMKIIRNRIAHISKHSEEKFRDLVRQKLGHNPKGMVPGKLLLLTSPSNSSKSILQEYGDVVLVCAKLIVP